MITRKLEDALRARIQRRYGDVFVAADHYCVRIYVDRIGYQSMHRIYWVGDMAWFDREVKEAIVGGAA